VSGFLDLMIKGIDVMADKGFLLQEQLESRGCLSWIPPVRRRGQEQARCSQRDGTRPAKHVSWRSLSRAFDRFMTVDGRRERGDVLGCQPAHLRRARRAPHQRVWLLWQDALHRAEALARRRRVLRRHAVQFRQPARAA
jgi:hypothetical protein